MKLSEAKAWLNERLSKIVPGPVNEHVRWKDDGGGMATASFFTGSYQYHVTVGKDDYLGCMVTTRKPLAGEDHTRGNDLPDGELSDQLFDEILRAIVQYEIVRLGE